eukprot:comp18819_c0_seq1/m.34315 comp18819_c0_seq1/g.34315  ORF comp18819_c0_seq1/g.34315 comp18819_c0_seq1/m.34315 type:complete len:500 (-) comp18819_c0_seq1:4-1503(-)
MLSTLRGACGRHLAYASASIARGSAFSSSSSSSSSTTAAAFPSFFSVSAPSSLFAAFSTQPSCADVSQALPRSFHRASVVLVEIPPAATRNLARTFATSSSTTGPVAAALPPARAFSTGTAEAKKSENPEQKQQNNNKQDNNNDSTGEPLGSAAVRRWLLVCSGMVFGMVVLGGVTRLTESGLSMTRWKPLRFLPPMNKEEWEEEFAHYKLTPEFLAHNSDMDIEGFKRIFFFEYVHRLWGRMIGIAFAGPMAYFWARGHFNGLPGMKPAMLTILAMIGGQGALGWYMVKSGLEVDLQKGEVPRVSHYRLAMHLLSAFAIYAGMVWKWLDLQYPNQYKPVVPSTALARTRLLAPLAAGLVTLTVASGALVAGLDAGFIYNEWPLMGGRIIPVDLLERAPAWINFFENPSTVQFDHRYLGYSSFFACSALFLIGRRANLPRKTRAALHAVAGMALVQVLLGISALITSVPVSLGALHQGGSLTLFTILLWARHEIRRIPK